MTGEGPAPLSFSAVPVGANRHPGKWVTATTCQVAAREGQRTQEVDVADITRFPSADRFASCNGTAPIEVWTTPATPGQEVTGDPAVCTPPNGGAPHIYVRGAAVAGERGDEGVAVTDEADVDVAPPLAERGRADEETASPHAQKRLICTLVFLEAYRSGRDPDSAIGSLCRQMFVTLRDTPPTT